MSTQPGSIWHNESLASECSRLWLEGQSAAEVARRLSKQFNISITRSAIIGRVNRAGLSGRDRPSHPDRPIALKGHARPYIRPEPKPKARIMVKTAVVKPLPVTADNVVMLNRKPLVDIGRDECRWVCDDGEALMCANPCEAEKSFCRDHSAIVFWRPDKPVMTGSQLARSLRRYVDR